MNTLKKLWATLALCASAGLVPHAQAQTAATVIKVSSDVSYEALGKWEVPQLNKILQVDTPAFAQLKVDYTPARNAVNLYRVTYSSVVPERDNKPILTSGLIAIPDTGAQTFPTVSYQHGTVYGKEEVPSIPEKSPETQLMIAQFAGQGYIVVGADYFGMGTSKEPEGYMVKQSHQQATYDMLRASRAVLNHMKLQSNKIFLSGWSQGGFVTMALLEKIEELGMTVDAAATASAPLDLYAILTGFMHLPRSNDAAWVNSLFILSSFAYENYYGQPGLARSLINDEYFEASRKAYEREPFNPSDIPTDIRKLLRKEYFDAHYFDQSAYGKLIANTHSYRWLIQSPVRNYYGDSDEAINVGAARLGMDFQRAIGNGNPKVQAISTGSTTHRGTFAKAVPEWKAWFDSVNNGR